MPIWLIAIQKIIIKHLRGAAVKAALLTLLKSAKMGGFRAWIIKTIVNEFFNEIGEPIIKAAFINMNYTYDRIEGKILIKRLKNAKDQKEYDSTIDIILDS